MTVIRNGAERNPDRKIPFLTHLAVYVVFNAGMIVWDLIFAKAFSWRVFPLFGWGAGVLFHGLLVYFHTFGADRDQRVMRNACSPAPVYRYPRMRRLAIDTGFNTVFCVVCALIVTYMMRIGPFGINLVFSFCIGTIGFLIVDGGRLLLWGEEKPQKITFFALLGVAIPASKYFGNMLAIRLLGLPSDVVLTAQSQNTAGFLILTVLACMFITWFFWNRGTLQKLIATAEAEKARAASIEKQAMQAQLQLLQAQIEPHMLFNTLANLQGLIAVDAQRAQHMLDQLILYLRATLSSSRAEQTTLAHEFSLMEAYLELMSVRMGARLSYSLQLPESLRQLQVPPMLLQPLVENAIKHGLEPKIEGGRIDVLASLANGMLTLTVIDTGLGPGSAKAADATESSHVGTSNVRERLQALYGDRASFSLTSNKPSGAIAQLDIPS